MPKKRRLFEQDEQASPVDLSNYKPAKPSVVYVSPMRLSWKNVIVGLIVGVIIVMIGVIGASLVLSMF